MKNSEKSFKNGKNSRKRYFKLHFFGFWAIFLLQMVFSRCKRSSKDLLFGH
jgi:hypothetical protein